MAYIVDGNDSIRAALRRQNSWINKTTSGDPSRIKAGYFVGNGNNGQAFVNYSDLPFTAPFAVTAMLGGAKQ